jgi:hypothetical protein
MSSDARKYIGLDVHKEATSIAVLNGVGKLMMESIIETKAATLLEFLHGLRGELHVTLEEGSWAAWLYDVLKPHVAEILVCNPRRNALLKEGSKSDKVDARKLAELLRAGLLRAVYHGENGLRTLRELARSYLTISKDQARVMSRLKALYRSWGIPCSGRQVYTPRHREQWLRKIAQPGVRRRAELFYQQMDGLSVVRHTVRGELLAETHDSAQHRYVDGQLQRSKKPQQIRGLNQNHNHEMKKTSKVRPANVNPTRGICGNELDSDSFCLDSAFVPKNVHVIATRIEKGHSCLYTCGLQ